MTAVVTAALRERIASLPLAFGAAVAFLDTDFDPQPSEDALHDVVLGRRQLDWLGEALPAIAAGALPPLRPAQGGWISWAVETSAMGNQSDFMAARRAGAGAWLDCAGELWRASVAPGRDALSPRRGRPGDVAGRPNRAGCVSVAAARGRCPGAVDRRRRTAARSSGR